jgi:hypothetical protein
MGGREKSHAKKVKMVDVPPGLPATKIVLYNFWGFLSSK